MATLNTANYFRLFDRGGIAPGKRADLVVFSDLNNIRAEMVFRGGRLAARDGEVIAWERPLKPAVLRSSMNVNWDRVALPIPAQGRRGRVIGVIPDQLITEHLVEDLTIKDGEVVSDPGRDVAKIAVIERHLATGNFGLGLVRGIGLQRGAIASTVAHDSHNIVVVGMDDDSMMTAAHAVADMRGGMAAVEGDRIVARLPLPIAGLMSDQPIETVRDQMEDLVPCRTPARFPAARSVHSHLLSGPSRNTRAQDHRQGPGGRGPVPNRAAIRGKGEWRLNIEVA